MANGKISVPSLSITSKNIRALMDEKKMSVKDLQKALCSEYPQKIYNWLKGASLPGPDSEMALSEIFGVPREQIIGYIQIEQYALPY